MADASVLTGSVGRNGANHRPDVRLVQGLLNGWRTRNGRQNIAVDGIVGDETTGAILDFQQQMGTGSDARLDPDGPTLRALFLQHFSAVQDQLRVSLYQYPSNEAHSEEVAPISRQDLQDQLRRYAEQLKRVYSQDQRRTGPSVQPVA